MAELWAILFLAVCGLSLALHIFSLPANWIVLVLLAVWKLFHPADMSLWFLVLMVAIAGVGEVIEFVAQVYGGKRFGSSGRGNLGGVIGAIAGAILGAPFFFGLGALVGALAGAYLGCLALEMGQGRSFDVARRSAWGSFWGKFFGLTAKFSLGVVMVVLAIPRVWPG
jgi:hypothetical protein